MPVSNSARGGPVSMAVGVVLTDTAISLPSSAR